MRPLVSSLLGAGILSGSISYHVGTTNFEIVTSLTEWFLKRPSFTFPFYVVGASIGIIFMTAGRRGSEVDEQVQKHGDSLAMFYASAGGSVAGWAGGVCLAALLSNPARYWLLSLLVVLMAVFTVVVPLIGMTFTRRMVGEFNNRWFRQRWRERYVRLIGLAVLALSIFLLINEIQA
jgi:hypothetical protein